MKMYGILAQSFLPQVEAEQTGLLILAGYVGVVFVLLSLRVLSSQRTLSAWFLFVVVNLYVPFMWRLRANRRCPYPDEGPALLITNHRSPVDPFLVCALNQYREKNGLFRLVSFLMAKEYYHIPGVAWACRTIECVPIARKGRDMTGVKDCLNLLKKGNLVGIFPEGRINTGEGLLPFGTGIAWLALRAKVPVFPVFIHDSPAGKSMVAPFFTRTHSRLVYGDPIDLSSFYADHKSKETLQEVTQLLHDRLAELEEIKPGQRLPL